MQTCTLSTCLCAGRLLCWRCGALLHVSTSITEEQPNRGNDLRRTSLKPTMPFSRSAIIPTHASARASSQIKSSSSTPTRPWSPSQSNPPAAPAHHSSFSPHAEVPPPPQPVFHSLPNLLKSSRALKRNSIFIRCISFIQALTMIPLGCYIFKKKKKVLRGFKGGIEERGCGHVLNPVWSVILTRILSTPHVSPVKPTLKIMGADLLENVRYLICLYYFCTLFNMFTTPLTLKTQ